VTSPHKGVMFSGGVPADSVSEVFGLLADSVGDRALAYPDGEIGDRRDWIIAINQNVMPEVAGIEVIGPSPYSPRFEFYKVTDQSLVDFKGKLPYARDAIAGYGIFQRLKQEGRIAHSVRFQMAIPGAHDVIATTFPDPAHWSVLYSAWAAAIQDECKKMLAVIPTQDLCLQIDWCVELVTIIGRPGDTMSQAERDRHLDLYTSKGYLNPQVAHIPEEVLLGFHICAGTFPAYPVADIKDIGVPVRAANLITRNAGRRVDYFHLPVIQSAGEAYFRALSDLKVESARIYLGLECNDGLGPMRQRMEIARRYLPEFGVAHYCGYLWNKPVMRELLNVLAKGSDEQAAWRPGSAGA
jgi:hypothetical protein